MRIFVAALCATLMLAGCTTQAPSPQADPVAAPVANPETPVQSETAQPTAPVSAGPIAENLPVPAPLPDGVHRVDLAADKPVDSLGLYFVGVTTGKTEGWVTPATAQQWLAYSLLPSPDERWITTEGREVGYLIRRSDGASFRYDSRRLRLKAGPGVFLAWTPKEITGDHSKCALLDEQMKLLSTFSLRDGCSIEGDVLFSPDGKMLAIATPGGAEPAVLVTVATGAVKGLGPFTAPDGLSLSKVYLSALPQLDQVMVELSLAKSAQANWPPRGAQVRRYTWQGDLRADTRLPGWSPKLSPNGKLLVYSQDLGLLGQAAVVQELGADQPLFRLAGGFNPQWLADSKSLLVTGSQGYQLLSTAGGLRPAPTVAGGAHFNPFVWLFPSPDNANLYITGGSVIDQTGKTVRAVTLADPTNLRIAAEAWSHTTGEFHFAITPPAGRGYEGEVWNYIRPSVQRPPFPDGYQLKVDDPKGDCLNLRAEPGKAGQLIRCLPTGTRLNLGPGTNINRPWQWKDEIGWLQVETDKGEQGWVAGSAMSVTYGE